MLFCGECKPPRNFHKRSGAVSYRDSSQGQTSESDSVTGATGQMTCNKQMRDGYIGLKRRSARLNTVKDAGMSLNPKPTMRKLNREMVEMESSTDETSPIGNEKSHISI